MVGAKNDVLISSAEILGLEEHDGTTYYRLLMTSTDESFGQWEIIRRYSEFRALHDELGAKDKRVGGLFPHKTGFFSCKDGALGQRSQLLQGWIDGLIADFSSGGDGKNIIPVNRSRKSEALHKFFGVDLEGRLQPDAVEVSPGALVEPSESQAIYGLLLPEGGEEGPLGEDTDVQIRNREMAEEDEQLQADLLAVRQAEEAEEARRKADEEAQLRADLEAIRELEEREAMLKAQEELQLQSEREAESKAAAEAEEAERLKVEEEETKRRIAEEEERLKAEEEEEARLTAEAEEAERIKAEEEERQASAEPPKDERTWLQKAVDLEKNARDLEALGRREEAIQVFKNCVQLFDFVAKRESSQRVREMIQNRQAELTSHADALYEQMAREKLSESTAPPPAGAIHSPGDTPVDEAPPEEAAVSGDAAAERLPARVAA